MPGADVMFELAEVETADGVLLQGLLSSPPAGRKLAVIYIHGLGGDFYGSPAKANALAAECSRLGFGFLSFNTRGSGLLSSVRKRDTKSPKGFRYVESGRCYERFEDCVFDIDALVKDARRRGFRKVALIGHSTGANKAVHYLSRSPDRSVACAVLTGPLSDVPLLQHDSGKSYRHLVSLAKRMVSLGKGHSLMPQGTPLWPLSAQRFLSLAVPGSSEDVFQYHMKDPSFRSLKKVRVPTLALMGGDDEYALQSPDSILDSYRKANPRIESAIIEGALHSFNAQEELMADVVCGWIKSRLRA